MATIEMHLFTKTLRETVFKRLPIAIEKSKLIIEKYRK